ncbi:MAG: DDE-type integrase/transposase/recombinase [Deltaproteobacteria bacterium]|nr:DDE-type integrase/transposase/recombinase [Deltaproteobacteria bacterium]
MWTWVAIDAESKLIPAWYIGPRDGHSAHAFMTDLAGRLRHRIQLTTDGHQPYVEAVESAFGCEIDYAQLIKVSTPSTRRASGATARSSARTATRGRSWATPTRSKSRPATSSARTSRCGCRSAATPG